MLEKLHAHRGRRSLSERSRNIASMLGKGETRKRRRRRRKKEEQEKKSRGKVVDMRTASLKG